MNLKNLEVCRNTLPEIFVDNTDYLFHGTSNLSEEFLDKGIIDNHHPVSLEIIDEIISIYQEINWLGKHGGGYTVLSTFSNRDSNSSGKFFFFGETPYRCALYASRDFAGGEVVRSVFYSIIDLLDYVNDPNVREKHQKLIERDFPLTGEKYDVDLFNLERKTNAMKPALSDVEAFRNEYKYGIIYCYEIMESDLPKLKHRNSMGIICIDPLPSDRLKAKLIFDNISKHTISEYKSYNSLPNPFTIWIQRLKKK